MARLQKYAGELRTYVFDFSLQAEIVAGDTISTISSVTATPSGLFVGASSIVGNTVKVILSQGTASTTYTVVCLITTSSGATIEGIGSLQVN